MSYQQPQGVHWQAQAPMPQPPRRRVIWPWIAIAMALVGALVIVVAVLITHGSNGTANSGLENIRQGCGLSSGDATIGDNGRTLTLDGQDKEDSGGLSWSEIECMLNGIKMPDSVRGRFGNTRALDGMQSASWDGYSATWNYHPDSGVSLVVTTVGK